MVRFRRANEHRRGCVGQSRKWKIDYVFKLPGELFSLSLLLCMHHPCAHHANKFLLLKIFKWERTDLFLLTQNERVLTGISLVFFFSWFIVSRHTEMWSFLWRKSNWLSVCANVCVDLTFSLNVKYTDTRRVDSKSIRKQCVYASIWVFAIAFDCGKSPKYQHMFRVQTWNFNAVLHFKAIASHIWWMMLHYDFFRQFHVMHMGFVKWLLNGMAKSRFKLLYDKQFLPLNCTFDIEEYFIMANKPNKILKFLFVLNWKRYKRNTKLYRSVNYILFKPQHLLFVFRIVDFNELIFILIDEINTNRTSNK